MKLLDKNTIKRYDAPSKREQQHEGKGRGKGKL